MSNGGRSPRPGPVGSARSWYRSAIDAMDWTRVAARNHWFKIRNLERCCGNHGQPGC